MNTLEDGVDVNLDMREEISKLSDIRIGYIDKSNYDQYLQVIMKLFLEDVTVSNTKESAYIAMLEIIQTCSLPKECSAEITKIPIYCFVSNIERIIEKMFRAYRYGDFDKDIYYKKRSITDSLYKAFEGTYLKDSQQKYPSIDYVCSAIILYLQLCLKWSAIKEIALENVIDYEFMRRVVIIINYIYN